MLTMLTMMLTGSTMNMGRRAVMGWALAGGVTHALAGMPQRQQKAKVHPALDAELAAVVADPACQLASLSVLAIRKGKIAYQQQFGQRFLGTGDLPAKPATPETLFRIASISKMMTTLALMRLVEQGRVALDTDVSGYLGFALRNPHFPDRVISLRMLLSHTSSLRDAGGYAWPASVSLRSVLVGGGAMWASDHAPGAYFTYANLGWGVIGTIMERVSGERFDRLMKRLLLDPLGMHGGFNPSELPEGDLANLATLYRKRTTDTEVWDSAGPWIAQVDDYSARPPAPPAGIGSYVIGSNATPFSPTGGLRVSAAGLGAVMLMLINDGVHQGRRILKPASLQTMFTRQWQYNGHNGDTELGLFHSWGLGTQRFGGRLVEGGGFTGVGHLGEAYGLMSVFAVDLAARSGMVLLVGGVGSDPAASKGVYSSMTRFEERILTAMHRQVLAR